MRVSLRRALIGKPIATARAAHERLDKWMALPIFASDAVSSSAYATEAILLALMAASVGVRALPASLPIAGGIGLLLIIVALSYRQTVLAYPTGGGAYIVGKENLGVGAATVAGAALMIDYVLTVSVSVAAGIQAITSAFEPLRSYTVPMGIAAIALLALANLRGVRESGFLFAVPSYSFMVGVFLTLVWGAVRLQRGLGPAAPDWATTPGAAVGSLSLFLIMRAYASGCAALTGIEAISNGVQAFRPPEGRNAATTMLWMAGILLVLFLGITVMANRFYIVPDVTAEGHGVGETVLSQVAATVWGGKRTFPYLFVQFSTMAILVLAANTSFAGFPRLTAILARDRFLPRQLANVGDRLVYNNGILILMLLSWSLIVLFRGSVHGLLPLYAVGVFLSFTVSQAGMVARWFRLRTPGWRRSAAMNAVGAVTTFVVLWVLMVGKFMPADANRLFSLPVALPYVGNSIRAGAWLVALLIPMIVWIFHRIHAHYRAVAAQLTLIGYQPSPRPVVTVIVLVPSVNRGIVPALQYAKALGQDTRALHIELDPENTPRLREEWEPWSQGIPLIILESPYRSLVDPLFRYLDEVQTEREHVVTVVLPEFVPVKLWHKALHNQSSLLLKLALLFRKDMIVTNVRYHLRE
ncbi:MAG: APC family permease [Armatimonadetes bacterium]|nr:APC family permease [Armatimonadota bacterium]